MEPAVEERRLRVSVQPELPSACVFRLTPALLTALREAKQSGAQACISFGPDCNVIRVGEQTFPFTSLPEQHCQLLSVPSGVGSGEGPCATLAGHATHKLMLSRSLAEQRNVVRVRGAEAERRSQERHAVVLEGSAAAGARVARGGRRSGGTMRRGVSDGALVALAGAGGRGLESKTGGVQGLAASRLRAPSPNPPPAMATTVKPSADRVGIDPAPRPVRRLPSPALPTAVALTGAAAAAAVSPSAAVMQAARGGSLRQVLVAALRERPAPMPTLRALLAAVAARVPGFRAPAARRELENAVRAVASFQAPGLYVLNEAAATGSAGTATAARIPVVKQLDPARHADGTAQQANGVTRDATPEPRAVSPDLPSSDVLSGETGSGGGAAVVGGTKRSGPSFDSGGGRDGGGYAQRRAGPATSSASSRALSEADEARCDSLLKAGPRSPPAAIQSSKEFDRCKEEFDQKYELYFRLHQLLQSCRRDFQAWKMALQNPGLNADEHARIETQIEERWGRMAQRMQRWDEAFRVLHVELERGKAVLMEYMQERDVPGSARFGAAGTLL